MRNGFGQGIARAVRAVAGKLNDALNPIAVKELRQAVQARFVTGLFVLLLVGQLVALGAIVLGRHARYEDDDLGRRAFVILYGILVGASVLCGPAYIGVRPLVESRVNETDLVSITPLRAATVVWGRTAAALALTALMFGTSAPFLVFTYMLRGVELSVILLLIVGGFIGTALAVQIAVFLTSLPLPFATLFRPLVGLVSLGISFLAAFGIIAAAVAVTGYEHIFYGLTLMQSWILALSMTVLGLVGFGFFFVLSLAVSLHRKANRALPVRAYMTAIWPVSLGIAAAWSLILKSPGAVHVWMAIWCGLLAVGLAVAVSERDVLEPRIARTIPKRRWRRCFAFLLYSGAAGGVVWCCLIMAITLAVGAVWDKTPWMARAFPGAYVYYTYVRSNPVPVIVGCALFAYAYTVTGALVRRWRFPNVPHVFTWAFGLGIAAAAFLAGVFVYVLAFEQSQDYIEFRSTLFTTPLVFGAWQEKAHATGYVFSAAWAVVVTPRVVVWLVDRMRSFRRLDLVRRVELGRVVYE